MQDVSANTVTIYIYIHTHTTHKKDSFENERRLGGFTPFSLDCLGGSWDPIELKVIELKVKLFGESK